MILETSHIILLSLIQGISEFLPISSSGHLVLLPALTSFADQGQLFDVAAHFGTLGAVMLYVRKQIVSMVIGTLTLGKRDKAGLSLSVMVIIASLPVIIIGLVIEIIDPAFLRFAITVALANLLFAGLLYQADKSYPETKQEEEMSLKDAWLIGLAQIFALIPGTSRSGVTMTAARARGFSRLAAARFSMLMAVPVIAGASLLKSRHFFGDGADSLSQDVAIQAGLVAALSGLTALIAITIMMRWLAHASFTIFVVYRLLLGVILVGAMGFGFISAT